MAVKGLDRLKRQLRALPPTLLREVSTGLDQDAGWLSDAIARAAPDPKLAKATGWTGEASAPRGALVSGGTPSARGSALSGAGLRRIVYSGGDDAFWARWTEFGTAAHTIRPKKFNAGGRMTFNSGSGWVSPKVVQHPGARAQPYFYPTIRARKKQLTSRMSRRANKAAKSIAGVN